MRNTTLILSFLILSFTAVAQTSGWRKNYQYTQAYGHKSDSLLILPKVLVNSALLEDGALRFNSTTGFLQLRKTGTWDDVSPYLLAGLSTFPDSTIQPWDNVLRAFEKTQGQINALQGASIENQDSVYQAGKFKLAGTSEIKSIANTATLSLINGSSDTTRAFLGFNDVAGNRVAYIGIPSYTDPSAFVLNGLLGRVQLTYRDTSCLAIGSWDGSGGGTHFKYTTFVRDGHWRFYDTPISLGRFEHLDYDPNYTIRVDGQLRFDTLRALNITSGSSTGNGSGKYLSVNSSGDIGLYDLRAPTAYLNGSSMQYTSTGDTLDLISLNTNFKYRIKLRKSGGTLYDAFYINGNNGNTGIGRTDVPEKLSVAGNIDLDGIKILTGNGDPNGSISAPVGSLFLRKDGAANTTLYIKESGTGNTGWGAK